MSLLFSRNLKFVNLKTTGNKIVLSICWLIEKMISNYDCKRNFSQTLAKIERLLKKNGKKLGQNLLQAFYFSQE